MFTTGRLLNRIYKSNNPSRGILEIWPPDTEKDAARHVCLHRAVSAASTIATPKDAVKMPIALSENF
jgi:hypothetical protein